MAKGAPYEKAVHGGTPYDHRVPGASPGKPFSLLRVWRFTSRCRVDDTLGQHVLVIGVPWPSTMCSTLPTLLAKAQLTPEYYALPSTFCE